MSSFLDVSLTVHHELAIY